MPTDYLKIAREYRRTGRADVHRRMALLEAFRDELLRNARFYERRAEEYERKEKL